MMVGGDDACDDMMAVTMIATMMTMISSCMRVCVCVCVCACVRVLLCVCAGFLTAAVRIKKPRHIKARNCKHLQAQQAQIRCIRRYRASAMRKDEIANS